ncbi:MAG: protein kinase [Gammaproteobacteria bacterium]
MSEDKLRNALRPGHVLHWYRIDKVLGQGGFGITYLAFDTNLDQPVAIKEYLPMELAVRDGDHSVYPASRAHDKRYRWGLDRFLTEARTLARFKHPAIVRVLSVFEANNTAYMVMEYQDGLSLQAVLDRRGTLPQQELVALVLPLLDGLETMHAQGFIHRDIKPANIYINHNGQPVLLDFGSARQALGEETRTLTSVVSPGYAPFEQYYSKSDRQGPWTDIYGLGATLYRCISGLQPMAAIDRSEAILKAERDVFVSATELGSGSYSREFLAAVDRALEFNEKKRPQSVAEWREAFHFASPATEPTETGLAGAFDEDDTTRFDSFGQPTHVIGTGAVVNHDIRRPAPPVSGPRSRRSGPADPRSAPRSVRGATASVEAPRRRWPWLLALLLLAGVAGAGYAWYAGLLPTHLLQFGEAQRLVAQGDRALSVGQAFEPEGRSALAFYARAWAASPGDEDVAHGLRLVGERLASALDEAAAAGDDTRFAALADRLGQIPRDAVDLVALRERVAAAGARQAERARQVERIHGYLDAAAADVKAGRLVGAGTDNALARYRAVQILEPDNADAAAGLAALAAAMAERGRASLAAGKRGEAAEWHGHASLIDAGAAAVVALGDALREERSEAERTSTIADLLARADDDITANRLTSPPGNNALERLQEVTRLDPDNVAAREGLRRIHDRYLAMATQALARDEFDEARQFASRALSVLPQSEPARTLANEISASETRRREEETARLAAEAEARQAAMQMQAEQAQQAAAARQRAEQDAEARRLLAEANRKAEEQRLAAEAERRAREAAANAVRRVVFDYWGFEPRYRVHGLTIDTVYAAIAPLFEAAGYTIVKRDQVHDAGWTWNNIDLVIYRLTVNENTATGQYSWAGSVNVFDGGLLKVSLQQALASPTKWTLSRRGLGPPTDLQHMVEHFVEMTRNFLANQPGRLR